MFLVTGCWLLLCIVYAKHQVAAHQIYEHSYLGYPQKISEQPPRYRFGLFYIPDHKSKGAIRSLDVNNPPISRDVSETTSSDAYGRFNNIFDNFKFHRVEEQNDVDRNGERRNRMTNEPYDYDDYSSSSSSHMTGPRQIENIETDHYHKEVPPYDVSNFKQKSDEKHAEVHYHQHKHVHKHEHKQEHVHEHKQDHHHKHLHNQQHKHEHKQEHKHGHNHKHEHKQDHKHDHHSEHKHNHHQDHKHDHKHGHKHHSENKHQHGHKHQHKHKHHGKH